MAIAACTCDLIHAKKLAKLSAGEVISETVEWNFSDDGTQTISDAKNHKVPTGR